MMRSLRPDRLGWVALGLALTSLPAAATELASATGASSPASVCRSMDPTVVALVCACVFVGSLAVMAGVFRALRQQGWSLANALSEPTRLVIPLQPGWSDSQGDRQAIDDESGHPGTGTAVQVLEPSSSRLIALVGSIAILLLYLGFGLFALYTFGLTCTLPASLGAITNFLYAGLALFAPYVANQVSSLFRRPQEGPAPQLPRADQAPPATPASSPPAAPPAAPPRPLSAAEAPATSVSQQAPASPSAPTPHLPHPLPHRPAGASPAERVADHASAAAPDLQERTPPPPESLESHEGVANAGTPPPAPTAAPSPIARAAASAPVAEVTALQPAVDLIASFEGFVDHAYPDPASGGEPWTLGYGFTRLDGRPVRPGDRIDQAQALQVLQTGVQACAEHLAPRIPYWREMVADQRCALISFAWNLGQDFYGDEAHFATISRVLRDRDWPAVPEALCLYINPGSSVSAGLLRRRRAEGDLWNRGLAMLAAHPTPAGAAPAPPAPSTGETGPGTASVQAPSGGAATPAVAVRSHPNPLVVPWFDQLKMDDGQGWRDCFSASAAMLAAYWGHIGNENDYNHLRQRYGDSTSAEAQLAALRHLGLQADFRTDGTEADLQREIDAGRPVAVGWLHHGPASDPSGGGHWTVVIGYDASGVIMNDPYGDCDLVHGGYPSNHDGADLHYSYRNWLPRWRPQGSGGWMLTCRPSQGRP